MSLSNLSNRAKAQEGFSLIELLVVVLIIGILAAIMIPRFLGQRENANNSQAVSSVTNAKTAADAFYQTNNESYGATDAALAAGILAQEPSLEPNGTWAATTPENTVNPKVVYAYRDGAGRNDGAYLCAVSKGTKWYCVHVDGNEATEYASGTGASPATGAAAAALTYNTNATTAGW